MTELVAFCYDFDKTLSPFNMQEQGLIQSLGCDVFKFWQEVDDIAIKNGMDDNLSYMNHILKKAEGKFDVTCEYLRGFGKKIKFFPGLDEWFEKINSYAFLHSLRPEHYIISSGLKEIIEGTSIAKNFTQIYASYYYYDETGKAKWPAQVINFTNKTQFLYRIKKGSLNINDMSVNDYMLSCDVRIPFAHFIYIGDSDTDIPCMSIVGNNGGFPIGVYNLEVQDKKKVKKLLKENRISYFAPADYTQDSQLYNIVCAIIDKISSDMRLKRIAGSLIAD